MSVQIKICGINDEISLKAATRADFIGFVFFQKSPRFVTAIQAQLLAKQCPKNQKKVASDAYSTYYTEGRQIQKHERSCERKHLFPYNFLGKASESQKENL